MSVETPMLCTMLLKLIFIRDENLSYGICGDLIYFTGTSTDIFRVPLPCMVGSMEKSPVSPVSHAKVSLAKSESQTSSALYPS